jgi:uncharacterized membrane-anchored protein YjiN (DUF445 family)
MSLQPEVRSTPAGRPPADRTIEDARLVALRRMRIAATLLLIAMASLYVATSYARAYLPWLDYVRAFAEAGVVGACADWFAVVALFRHPFGIPIPHTAIVPHNKTRIAGAMGRFVSNNFLTPRVLTRRLATIDAAGWLTDWLGRPENARRFARVVAVAVVEIAQTLPRERIGELLRSWVRHGLSAMPAAPVASHLLAIVWAQGQTQALIERSLDLVEASLTNNKDVIRKKLEAGSSRWIPRFVDGMLADKMFAALTGTLTDMRDPAHPWRQELKATVEQLIERLKTDPELASRVEAIKQDMIAAPLFHDQLHAVWAEIENHLPTDVTTVSQEIASTTEQAMAGAARWLEGNPSAQQSINRWMRYFIRRIVAPRRAEIGAFVTQVVENWDATTLVNRIELQVGKDLQYIRINGTLVGGLVGLIIYTATTWLLPS